LVKSKVGLITAVAIVIANIIGTGVFTSIGFQAANIPSEFPLIMLWVIGGFLALFGALSYGELASAMPHSGGEYYYLSRIYHPAIGFLAGWVSLIVGFSAPIALAAIAFGSYLNGVFPQIPTVHSAGAIVILVTLVHSFNIKTGSAFQVIFTTIKVILILVFIIAGFLIANPQDISLMPKAGDMGLITGNFFAISLIFVTYAYSGWNAATYIASEIESPSKNVPKALLIGTLVVMVLYALINYIFMLTTPLNEFVEKLPDGSFTGRVEVGLISARHIFGSTGGDVMGLIIATLLISTISAMIFVGPRVIQAMAKDLKILSFFSKNNRNDIPVRCILFQMALTLIFIYSSSFEVVLNYAGFTLNLFTLLTVLGLFVHRYKNKKRDYGYKTWGYPVVPVLFILLNLWILIYLLINKTVESVSGLATVAAGLIFFYLGGNRLNQKLSD
jgi:basic amino acid/polyamine antiporter, APA family